MAKFSKIGSNNWITGANTNIKSIFQYSANRKCELIIGEHTRITEGHFIDCNGGVYIGPFTTIAGLKTQILSHSIDIKVSRQTADPIKIGKYCFVSTSCILLKNSELPDYSVLAAGSVLTKKFEEPYGLYAGNPAKFIKSYDPDSTMYFKRGHGHVV